MKFLKVVTFTILLSTLLFSSCKKSGVCIRGEGDTVTRILDVPYFNAFDLTESATVVVKQGTIQEVKVVGHSNIISRLETDVSGDFWEIELEDGCYDNYDLVIYITIPYLQKAALSGSGEVTIYGFNNVSYLDLTLPGSGNINAYDFKDATRLNVMLSGSGNIRGYGNWARLKNVDAMLSGSGNLKLFPLKAEKSKVLISGSGNIEIQATSRLDVRISGSGNVLYKGYPVLNSDISGSGSLINSN
jgi:hypothetical protein